MSESAGKSAGSTYQVLTFSEFSAYMECLVGVGPRPGTMSGTMYSWSWSAYTSGHAVVARIKQVAKNRLELTASPRRQFGKISRKNG
jgi:hypothetical protein